MFLIVGWLLGRFGTIGRCGQYEMFRAVSRALLWFGSRGGLLGSTPSKNEVSGQFCLLVLSVLRLLLDLRDAFVAMQSGVNCFDCRIASLGWEL